MAVAFAAGFLAGRLFVAQALGLFGFDFRFGFDIELFVVIGFLDLRRRSRGLRRKQRLGRLQRMHLFAAIDDEGLQAADRGIGDHPRA